MQSVRLAKIDIGAWMFAAAVALLAAGPVGWLIGTWRDPAFASHGLAYFAIVAVLTVWSLSSPRIRAATPEDTRLAMGLLCATALVRLAGQVLAVDTIGALALVIDVFALARLAGLHRRVRALSPFWLAAAFAFALPLERIVQRLIGFGLQDISARGACGALSALFGDVRCAGVRISVEGADVLVDLPCSGARALIVFMFAFAVCAALARPGWRMALLGCGVALAAAVLGNVLRITLLASGVALTPERLGFDVMAQPGHDVLGLVSMALAAPALMVWARLAVRDVRDAPASAQQVQRKRRRVWPAACFLAAAAAIVHAPRQPVDVSAADVRIAAPARIGAAAATPLPLTDIERAYFEQYGGAAVKAGYGPFALMLARTSSPLRHLHAPDECLRGLGYTVSYLGMSFGAAPSAHYLAVAPDGRAYRVFVSFFSNRGHRTASISEAVWVWLRDRGTVWTAVQRVAPENADAAAQAAFEAGVFAALDLSAEGGERVR